MTTPPENANARRQPGERVILTNCAPSVAPVSPGIKLISLGDGGREIGARELSAPRPESKRPAMRNGDTFGPPELCAWQVVPGVFWIQTTEPQFSRKLEKREDARRVEISGVNHFRRTFELRGTWRKVRRIIDRYLVSAGDQFSPDFRPQVASKTAGSIKTAGGTK
jgi:hypothetical protein